MGISSENLSRPNIWAMRGKKQDRSGCGDQNTCLSSQKAQGEGFPPPTRQDDGCQKGRGTEVRGRGGTGLGVGGCLLGQLGQKGRHSRDSKLRKGDRARE